MTSAACPVCNQNTGRDPQTGRCTVCGRLPQQTAYDDAVQRAQRASGARPTPSAAYRQARTVVEIQPTIVSTWTSADAPVPPVEAELPLSEDSDEWDDEEEEQVPWFKFGSPTLSIGCECGATFTYLETSRPPDRCAFCQKAVA